MARLVNASKAEVAILADLTVFGAVYDHGIVSSGAKRLAMRVFHCQTDGFTTEPVALTN
jgi:hypothetical protein